jgi:hypothetical protein
VRWTAPANAVSAGVTGYSVRVVNESTGTQVGPLRTAAADATSLTVTGLANGTTVKFQVRAANTLATGVFSDPSEPVTPAAPPGAPLAGNATAGNVSAVMRWAAPASDGGAAITGYSVRVVNAATLAQTGALRPAAAGATSLTLSGLVNGTAVRFQVRAANALATGGYSALSNVVTPATLPGAPRIALANPGAVGGTITARANWTPPASSGGLAINGYVVTALRMSAKGAVLSQTSSAVQRATARSLTMTLKAGSYRFTVRARNGLGLGAASARSQLVGAR